jgi:hypothetical protein
VLARLIGKMGTFLKGAFMAEFHLVLSEQEKSYLEGILKSALSETRVEVHRTHTPDYRTQVLSEEDLVRKLIDKVQQAKT